MRILKRLKLILSVLVPIIAFSTFGTSLVNSATPTTPVFGDGNINVLPQFTSTTSPTTSITQRTFGKSVYLTGLSDGCMYLLSGIITTNPANITCSSGGGGGGGAGTFATSTAWGSIFYNYPLNQTDVVLIGYDGAGVATSTNEAEFSFDPTAKLALFLQGTKVGIGTTSPYATLSVVGQAVASYFTATSTTASVFPLANITKLSNLTSNGFVKTSGSDGTLSVDTTTYLSAVTATSPLSGSGTGGSPLVIQNAAADGSTKGAASFTAADFDASSGNISIDYTNGQAASGANKGFLTSSDWTTFNNKQATISATFPITLSGATVGFGGLSTSSAPTISNLPYWTGVNTFGSVATTSVSCSGDTSCTSFTVIGSSPITISSTGSGGSSFPFTPTTNYAALTNATGTPVWFQSGLQASSTSYFVNASTTDLSVNGVLRLVAGSKSAPPIVVDGNTNTGIYTSISGTAPGLGLAVSGTSYLYTSDSGSGVKIHPSWGYCWGNSQADSTDDLCLNRNAAGLVEISDGTDGSFADIILRNASTTRISASYASSTLYYGADLQTCDSVTGKLAWANGRFTCGVDSTGGGGSGGGTWSTTTSQISGQLINYPNNTTDIVAIGASATTSAEYWFDPNAGVSYLSGLVGIGTTNPTEKLTVAGGDVILTTGVLKFGTGGVAQIEHTVGGGNDLLITGSATGQIYFPSGGDIGFSSTGGLSLNNTLTGSDVVFDSGKVGIGTTSPYAKLSVVGETVSAYFTATSSTASTFPYASTTALTVSGSQYNTSLTSAIIQTGSDGLMAEYAGTSCTNQFVRSLSALGVATCATVGSADVSLANLTATDSTLTFSGTYNGSTARTIGLNLGNANTWTALQTFGNSSTTLASFDYASSTIWRGGGLNTDCDGDTQALGWDITTGQFTCGDDDNSGGGGGSVGGFTQLATSTSMSIDICDSTYATSSINALGVGTSNIAVTMSGSACLGKQIYVDVWAPLSGLIGTTTFSGVYWNGQINPGSAVVNGLTDRFMFTVTASSTTFISAKLDSSY